MSVAVHDLPIAGEGPRALLAKMPPSDRDFEVYAQLVAGGSSTRETAALFGICQTRVIQIRKRVRAWMDEVDPDAADEKPSLRQLQVAQGLAADRLDHLYGQALAGWNQSKCPIERIRANGCGERTTTITSFHGDPRYLMAAARVTLMQSTVASPGMIYRAWAKAADALEAGSVTPGEAAPPLPSDDPPKEHCSAGVENGPVSGAAGRQANAASSFPARRLDRSERRQQAARDSFFAPVQPGQLGELAASVLHGHQPTASRQVTPSGG